jgi:hypothetical protein
MTFVQALRYPRASYPRPRPDAKVNLRKFQSQVSDTVPVWDSEPPSHSLVPGVIKDGGRRLQSNKLLVSSRRLEITFDELVIT